MDIHNCDLRTHTHMYAAGAGERDLAHLKIHCHRAAVETVLRKVYYIDLIVVVHINAAAAYMTLWYFCRLLAEWKEKSSSQN